MANAGIDRPTWQRQSRRRSPAAAAGPGRLGRGAARRAGSALRHRTGVIISDSFGRPWRRGVVNIALGAAGIPALLDRRGETRSRRAGLEVTEVALGDALAAAAGLVMGEAAEGIPAVLVRGCTFAGARAGTSLIRPQAQDLFRDAGVVAIRAASAGPSWRSAWTGCCPQGHRRVIVNTRRRLRAPRPAYLPDIDTALYTLAGLANPETGWGRRGETWTFMAPRAARRTDLVPPRRPRPRDCTSSARPARCRRNRQRRHLRAPRAPARREYARAADDGHRCAAWSTDRGALAFQDYFVRERCAPRYGLRFEGAAARCRRGGARRPRRPARRRSSSVRPTLASASTRSWRCRVCAGLRRRAPIVCGLAHRRRQGGQGSGRQDHGRAGPPPARRRSRGTMRG